MFKRSSFLDTDKIIRIHTSVEKCPGLSYDQINPILLPPKDPYSNLIGKVCHVQAGHMGTHYTASKIRNKWWITKITSLISKVIKGCQICLVERGSRYHVPDSPSLPEFRFDTENPYRYTAVDMTGHFFTRESKSSEPVKVYLLIFACMPLDLLTLN